MKSFFTSLGIVTLMLSFTTEVISTPLTSNISVVKATSDNIYDMNPLPSERLDNEIKLSNCPWIKIIEWRSSTDNHLSGPSEKAKDTLDKACHKATQKFSIFLKSQKINIKINLSDFHQNLCLIPLSDSFRNLNDISFRFKDREKNYNDKGHVNEIWGYTSFVNNTIFMRNDIINKDGSINNQSVVVFTHELYHALSWQFKINTNYYNDVNVEEHMAQKFTIFLGMGK